MIRSSGNRQIEVFRAGSKKPIQRIRYKVAKHLVDQGRAEFTGERSVQLLSRSVVAVSCSLITTNQDAVYESAAIEKNRRYVMGGLVRNEHQPKEIPKFKGARVGH